MVELVDLTDVLAGKPVGGSLTTIERVHAVYDISDTCWILGQAEVRHFQATDTTYEYFRYQQPDCEPKPDLVVDVFPVDQGRSKDVREDETMAIRVRVTNQSGQPVTGVRLDRIELGGNDVEDYEPEPCPEEEPDCTLDPDAGKKARLDGPTGEYPALTTSLGTGTESVGFVDYELTGLHEGEITVDITAVATKGAETVTAEVSEPWTVRSSALKVDISLSPDKVEVQQRVEDQPAAGGDGKAEPVPVTATLTVTNTDEEGQLTDVTWPETLDLVAADDKQTELVRVAQVSGPSLPDGASGPVDLDPFVLAAGASRTVSYGLEVYDDGRFTVRGAVPYVSSQGANRLAIGNADLKATGDRILGFVLEPIEEWPEFLTGGQSYELIGDLYNFSSTDTVKVDLASIELTHVGNGVLWSVRPLDAGWVEKQGQCYWSPALEIEPGERVPVHALLVVDANGGTRGGFELSPPDAWRIDEGDVETPLDPVNDYDIEPVDPVGYEYRVDVSVDTRGPWTLADYATFGNGLATGFVEGALEWSISSLEGTAALLKAVTTWENLETAGGYLAEYSLKSAEFYAQWTFVMTPEEKLAFYAEAAQQAAEMVAEAGKKAVDPDFQRQLAESVLPGWFEQVEKAYATNDPQALGEAFGRVTGNAGLEVASCLMPSPKWQGKFKTLATAAGAEAAEEAARIARIAEGGADSFARQATRATLRNGSLVDAQGATKLWGLGSDAYRSLLKFADENKLLISLRDRSPGSLKRLQEGFIEKMEHMKLKNVNLDIDGPLGYLDEHADIVTFKKPISQSELDEVLAGISDADLRDEVLNRWKSRNKEWNKYKDLYASFEENGFPSGFEFRPNAATGRQGAVAASVPLARGQGRRRERHPRLPHPRGLRRREVARLHRRHRHRRHPPLERAQPAAR